MLVSNPKYRRPISSKQIELLKCLYKFRYVTVPLLAEYLGKDKSTVYESLYVLQKQQYITRTYDKTYRLPPKPARYFLAAKGIKYLREHTKLNQTVLRNFYKNKRVREEHIEHCLRVFAVYIALQHQTKGVFALSTKYEITGAQFFSGLKPLPDIYLNRKKQHQTKQYDFMLDILDPDVAFWRNRKRLQAYDEHCEEAEESYPDVLLVAPRGGMEQRIRGFLENFFSDFEVYTTTVERILDPENNTSAIWKEVFEEDEQYRLNDLPVNP